MESAHEVALELRPENNRQPRVFQVLAGGVEEMWGSIIQSDAGR